VTALLSFAQALAESEGTKRRVLLGNGFSRALRDNIFAYGALFERADFGSLSPAARAAFDALGTRDFEKVMTALRNAAILLRVYDTGAPTMPSTLEADADGLRDVLVRAIADSHPAQPREITDHAYAACRIFLAPFEDIYTVNYDLLLYWAQMHEDSTELSHDDGFRTPEAGAAEYVSWDIEKSDSQSTFYLHGALHIFDTGAELVKYTWINTGVRLIDQVREALTTNRFPVFVSEGDSASKLARIRHSDFLSRSFRSFAKIGGALFVYGLSFADNDEHILKLIGRGKLKTLYVSIYGDPSSTDNQRIIRRAQTLDQGKRKLPLGVRFFDAQSASVWG
jgi:hypothetical protein